MDGRFQALTLQFTADGLAQYIPGTAGLLVYESAVLEPELQLASTQPAIQDTRSADIHRFGDDARP
jgi:hypothetical protein